MTTFNTSQQNGINIIESFFESEDSFLIIIGPAGTGKTFCISHLVKKHKRKYNFHVIGPTNKSVSVLKQNGLHAQTITKFLKMQQSYNDDGSAVFTPDLSAWSKMNIRSSDVVIADECSMIGVNLFYFISEFQLRFKCKFIFLGDVCQLPPIQKNNLNSSVSFQSQTFNINNKIEFSELVRSQIPVIQLTYNLFRQYAIDGQHTKLINGISTLPQSVHVRKTDDKILFVNAFLKSFRKCNNSFILCCSNANTTNFNKIIIDSLYPNRVYEFVEGQRLIFTDYHRAKIIYEDDDYDPFKTHIGIYTGDLIIIESILESNIFNEYFDVSLKLYIITFSKEYHKCIINYIHKQDQTLFNNVKCKKRAVIKQLILDKHNASDLWAEFNNNVSELHAPIDSAYAMTVYKSQGSSFTSVYIDLVDISRCRSDTMMRSREYYTAVSRAKKMIVLLVGNSVNSNATNNILCCPSCKNEKNEVDFISGQIINNNCHTCTNIIKELKE